MTDYTWDNIRRGLKLYTEEDEDSPYYINKKTYEEAIKIANTFETFKFPVPRIFCHGGECAVFIWGDLGCAGYKPLQVYISITEDGPGRLTIRNYNDDTKS